MNRLFFIVFLFALGCSANAGNSRTGTQQWPQFQEWKSTNAGPKDVAFIVAIEDYAFMPDVPGAVKTANDWENYFRQNRGLSNVYVLTDQNAPIEEVHRQLDNALASTDPNSKFWFVFVGHGAASSDGQDGLLVGMDAQQTMESLQTRSLSRNDLQRRLSRGQQSNTVMILDACFSGRSSSGEALVTGAQPVIAVRNAQAAPNFVVMTAASADEVAGALPGEERPAFSYLLLGGMRGWADTNGDAEVTADELAHYATANLRFVPGRQQIPTITGATTLVVSRGANEVDPGVDALMTGRTTRTVETQTSKEDPFANQGLGGACETNSDCFTGISCNAGVCGGKTKKPPVAKGSRLQTLNTRKFEYLGLSWDMSPAQVKRIFGEPYDEKVANARLTEINFPKRKFFEDKVTVHTTFRSGKLKNVAIVIAEKYDGPTLNDAFRDWLKSTNNRLGRHEQRYNGGNELAAVWYLDDNTTVAITLEHQRSLMEYYFFAPGFSLNEKFAKPDAPGSLGVVVEVNYVNGKSNGLRIVQFEDGSPLPAANFRVGDVISNLDGIEVRSMRYFTHVLNYYPPGSKVDVKIERGTASVTLK